MNAGAWARRGKDEVLKTLNFPGGGEKKKLEKTRVWMGEGVARDEYYKGKKTVSFEIEGRLKDSNPSSSSRGKRPIREKKKGRNASDQETEAIG